MTTEIILAAIVTVALLVVLGLSWASTRLEVVVEDETLDPEAGEFVVPLAEVPTSLLEAIDAALKVTTDPEKRDHLLEARIAAMKERVV